MKTNELTGAALDWAVAKCEGIGTIDKFGSVWVPIPKEPHFNEAYEPSTNWAHGGPIIERELITISAVAPGRFVAGYAVPGSSKNNQIGAAPLIAAMRCYVASKLGDSVEVPKELL